MILKLLQHRSWWRYCWILPIAGVPDAELDEIDGGTHTRAADLMKEMLKTWIEKDEEATIVKLIEAICSRLVYNERLARKIASDDKILKKYGRTGIYRYQHT